MRTLSNARVIAEYLALPARKRWRSDAGPACLVSVTGRDRRGHPHSCKLNAHAISESTCKSFKTNSALGHSQKHEPRSKPSPLIDRFRRSSSLESPRWPHLRAEWPRSWRSESGNRGGGCGCASRTAANLRENATRYRDNRPKTESSKLQYNPMHVWLSIPRPSYQALRPIHRPKRGRPLTCQRKAD